MGRIESSVHVLLSPIKSMPTFTVIDEPHTFSDRTPKFAADCFYLCHFDFDSVWLPEKYANILHTFSYPK